MALPVKLPVPSSERLLFSKADIRQSGSKSVPGA
jgi:hypothetical protein